MTTNWPNVTKVHVVILNPYYFPSSLSTVVCRATVKKLSLTMAWSQCRVVFLSTCHQTCMDVCKDESVYRVGECEGVYGGLYQLFLVKVKVYCACPCACLFCAAAVSLSTAWRHSGPPRYAPLLSPWLSGRKVLMAAAMPDSLSICSGWHSSFTVTSPHLTALARAPCYFSFSLQTCTW